MLRRGLLVGGLGLSLTAAGIGALPGLAQSSDTSTATETVVATEDGSTATREERRAELQAEREAQADEFLAKFTEKLGLSDPEQVETALKETLKEMIEDKFAAGEISRNQADEQIARIDAADSVLDLGIGGFGGGFMGRGPGGSDSMRGGPRSGGGRSHQGTMPRDGAGKPGAETDAQPALPAPGSLPADDEAGSTPEA